MPTLAVSMDEARRTLVVQINEATGLDRALSGAARADFKGDWTYRFGKWIEVTKAALSYVYAGDEEAKRFADDTNVADMGGFWRGQTKPYRHALNAGLARLRSLNETLPFAAPPPAAVQVVALDVESTQAASRERGEIFLVHGHDRRRNEVKSVLENTCQSRYKVVVLDEQPARGRTLIERLEQHGQDAAYAVILFTGDDVGVAKADAEKAREFNPRARQNVVFEFGWFCGQLGRERVAVLYESDVELPSDIGGLTFIDLGNDDWKVRLARDLRAAGLVEPRSDDVFAGD